MALVCVSKSDGCSKKTMKASHWPQAIRRPIAKTTPTQPAICNTFSRAVLQIGNRWELNMMPQKIAMESKPTDVPVLFVRRGSRNLPIELCMGSRETLQVTILRPNQAKNMLRDLATFLTE